MMNIMVVRLYSVEMSYFYFFFWCVVKCKVKQFVGDKSGIRGFCEYTDFKSFDFQDHKLWVRKLHWSGDSPSPVRSENRSEELIPVPNSSQGTNGSDIEVCAALQVYASPDHPWPTAKLVMLDDVTGSLTITMPSPNLILACHICSVWTRSHLLGEWDANGGRAIVVFSQEWQSRCMVLGCEQRSH